MQLGRVHRRVDWVRVLFWLGLAVLWGMCVFSGVRVFASDGSELWSNDMTVISSSDVTGSAGYDTGCLVGPVVMSTGERINEGCIYGQGGSIRVASFTPPSGGYRYAVSFPGSGVFYTLTGVCENVHNCAYGQASDTLLIRYAGSAKYSVVRNFSKKMQRKEGIAPYFTVSAAEAVSLPAGSSAKDMGAFSVSQSGKWAVFEMRSYGLLRVNLETLEQRRISAPGYSYGYGHDPTASLAISDDGKTVAASGWNVTTEIFQVTNGCGGEVDDTMGASFQAHDYPCHRIAPNMGKLFGNVISARRPTLSPDGSVFGLDVFIQGGQRAKRVALRDARTVTTSPPAADTSRYLAFGDSYTSGEGETNDAFYEEATNIDSNRCHVSKRSYPYLIGASWGLPTQNKACSGAQMDGVRTVLTKESLKNTGKASHVSIGVGGNDIGLMGKLSSCIGIGTCEWAQPARRRASYEEIYRIVPRLEALVAEAKGLFPEARIALIGYPRVVNTDVGATCSALMNAALNQEERKYLDMSIQALNRAMYEVSVAQSVTYVATESALQGIGLCDATEVGMNAVRFGDDIAPIKGIEKFKMIGAESFHPTPTGHEAIAAAIQAVSRTPWSGEMCAGCIPDLQFEAYEYWQLGEPVGSSRGQYAQEFLSATRLYTNARKVKVSFGAGSFSPGSSVSLEIHSEPIQLATVKALADGSLSAEVVIPTSVQGHHTVHAMGVGFAGDARDYYQAVAIEDTEAPGREASVVPGNTEIGEASVSDMGGGHGGSEPRSGAGGGTTGGTSGGGGSVTRSLASVELPSSSPDVIYRSMQKEEEVPVKDVEYANRPVSESSEPSGSLVAQGARVKLPYLVLSVIGLALVATVCFVYIIQYRRRGEEAVQ